MNALFQLDELRRCDHRLDDRDWLTIFREAEARAELAAERVRETCDLYRRDRNRETEAAYAAADRAYDLERLRFQLASCEIVKAVRAVASLPRAMRLASEPAGRML